MMFSFSPSAMPISGEMSSPRKIPPPESPAVLEVISLAMMSGTVDCEQKRPPPDSSAEFSSIMLSTTSAEDWKQNSAPPYPAE